MTNYSSHAWLLTLQVPTAVLHAEKADSRYSWNPCYTAMYDY